MSTQCATGCIKKNEMECVHIYAFMCIEDIQKFKKEAGYNGFK